MEMEGTGGVREREREREQAKQCVSASYYKKAQQHDKPCKHASNSCQYHLAASKLRT